MEGTCLEVLRTRYHDDCHVVFRFVPVSFQFWPNNSLLSTCRTHCFSSEREKALILVYVEGFVGPSGMTLTTSELDDNYFFVNFPRTNSIVCHPPCAVFCPHAQFLHSLWIPASGCTATRKSRRTFTSDNTHRT